MLFCICAWAQNGARELQATFVYPLRVAQAPCPGQLPPVLAEATCYRHGYADFFDFKDAVAPYLFEPGSYPEPWRVIMVQLASGAAVFRTKYRPRGSKQEITLIYLDDELLLLLTKDLRPGP